MDEEMCDVRCPISPFFFFSFFFFVILCHVRTYRPFIYVVVVVVVVVVAVDVAVVVDVIIVVVTVVIAVAAVIANVSVCFTTSCTCLPCILFPSSLSLVQAPLCLLQMLATVSCI